MDRRRLLWVALPFLAAAECGPTPREAGTAALVAILPVLLLEALALVGLVALWRRYRPDLGLTLPWLAWTALFTLHVLAFLVALPAGGLKGGWAYAGLALYLVGSTHAAVLLVAWRATLALRPARASVVAPVVASVIVIGPALPMVAGIVNQKGSDLVIDAWTTTGAGGWTPFVILVLLVAEVGIRIGRARRAAGVEWRGSVGPPR